MPGTVHPNTEFENLSVSVNAEMPKVQLIGSIACISRCCLHWPMTRTTQPRWPSSSLDLASRARRRSELTAWARPTRIH